MIISDLGWYFMDFMAYETYFFPYIKKSLKSGSVLTPVPTYYRY